MDISLVGRAPSRFRISIISEDLHAQQAVDWSLLLVLFVLFFLFLFNSFFLEKDYPPFQVSAAVLFAGFAMSSVSANFIYRRENEQQRRTKKTRRWIPFECAEEGIEV